MGCVKLCSVAFQFFSVDANCKTASGICTVEVLFSHTGFSTALLLHAAKENNSII
jgi:hypothetical protein